MNLFVDSNRWLSPLEGWDNSQRPTLPSLQALCLSPPGSLVATDTAAEVCKCGADAFISATESQWENGAIPQTINGRLPVCLASARFPAALYITMILSISDQDHVVPPDWKRHSRFKQSVAERKRAGSPAHSQSHYTRGIADDNLMCILPVGTDTNYCILLQATESAKVSKVVVALLIQVLRHRKDFAIDIDAFRAHGCTWG